MSQHYTRNTKSVSVYCSTCRRNTIHRVDDRRLGPCTEHGGAALSKDQEKRQKAKQQAEQNPMFEF
jgi:ribosomal protein L44E